MFRAMDPRLIFTVLVAMACPATTFAQNFRVSQVSSVTPTTIGSGDDVHVIARVANAPGFTGNVPIDIVLSADPFYDSQDVVLDSGFVFLVPSSTTTYDVTFTLSVSPGQGLPAGLGATVFVVVDPRNSIPEYDETDNAAAATQTLTIRGADVFVQTITTAGHAFIGRDFQVELTLENGSDVDANQFRYRYYLSEDQLIRVFDTPIFTSQHVDVAANQTVTFVDTVTLPATFTATASLYVGVHIDIFTELFETNSRNNTAVARPPIDILFPIPDLVGQIVETAPSGAAAEDFAITRVIANAGVADAPAFDYAYFLSRDESLERNVDIPLGVFSSNALPWAEDDYDIDVLRIPGDTPSGQYWLLMDLDVDGVVTEVDETNNVVVGPRLPFFAATMEIVTDELPIGTTGVPYEIGVYARGGPLQISWSVADGMMPPGLTLASGGIITGTPTEAGLFAVTFRASSGSAYVDRAFDLRIVTPSVAPTIATTKIPAAFVNQAFCHDLIVVGGQRPYVWSAVDTLPPGTELSADGRFCGTVAETGGFRFQIQVVDDLGVPAREQITFHVLHPDQAVQIVDTQLPFGILDQELCDLSAVTLEAERGVQPYKWAIIGGEIPGVNVSLRGELCGAPQRAGMFSITVRVEDDVGSIDTALILFDVEASGGFAISTFTLPDAEVGVPYELGLDAVGGTDPITWTEIANAGEMIPGVTFSADGRFTGTPTEGGSYAFAIRAEDARGQVDIQSLSVFVAEKEAPPADEGCTCVTPSERSALGLLLVIGFLLRLRRR